jgi:hypothetical protein
MFRKYITIKKIQNYNHTSDQQSTKHRMTLYSEQWNFHFMCFAFFFISFFLLLVTHNIGSITNIQHIWFQWQSFDCLVKLVLLLGWMHSIPTNFEPNYDKLFMVYLLLLNVEPCSNLRFAIRSEQNHYLFTPISLTE